MTAPVDEVGKLRGARVGLAVAARTQGRGFTFLIAVEWIGKSECDGGTHPGWRGRKDGAQFPMESGANINPALGKPTGGQAG